MNMVKIVKSEVSKKGIHEFTFCYEDREIYTVGFANTNYFGDEDKDEEIRVFIAEAILFEEDAKDVIDSITIALKREKIDFLFIRRDKNQERERIGKAIKEIREEKDLEAKELAQKADIDAANLSRIEQGKFSTGIDTMNKIASALDAKLEIVPKDSIIIKEETHKKFSEWQSREMKERIKSLIHRVLTEDITELSKNTRLWYANDTFITDNPMHDPEMDWYGKTYVVTPHAKELSWLIEELWHICYDYLGRELFFLDCLANAALRYIDKGDGSMRGLLVTVITDALLYEPQFMDEFYLNKRY